jgi:hypothetical protein
LEVERARTGFRHQADIDAVVMTESRRLHRGPHSHAQHFAGRREPRRDFGKSILTEHSHPGRNRQITDGRGISPHLDMIAHRIVHCQQLKYPHAAAKAAVSASVAAIADLERRQF